ncbi:MAG: hypothetical protein JNK85_19360 [Verrucomicrobiales bacterium]|nr:hypothetical protein [Verrucomicrobiales bacterium]
MLRLFDRLKLTPAERRLVMIILAVVFVVLNYWLVWPRFSDFRTLSDDLEAIERKRRLYQAEIDRRPTYEVMLRKLQAAGSVLPVGEERIQFRTDMERVAREVGLAVPRWGEVLQERSTGSSSNAFFEAISLAMNQVSGTEDQFVDFLYRVGASNSTIRVKELTLMPGNFDPRAQGKTNLVGTLKLVASVQKAAPKVAAPSPAATAPAPRTNAPASISAAVAPKANTSAAAAASTKSTNTSVPSATVPPRSTPRVSTNQTVPRPNAP